ncbi:transmembrane protein 150A isoform X3 [Falco cherrug]|uniref:transmembrane protein 150A isoform X3 n=1 Tax=Falco cherrug TaxID=345164 RepID=UPI002478D929|nr:transmembrane protein 150A isoform X3 [Falco cherrug]
MSLLPGAARRPRRATSARGSPPPPRRPCPAGDGAPRSPRLRPPSAARPARGAGTAPPPSRAGSAAATWRRGRPRSRRPGPLPRLGTARLRPAAASAAHGERGPAAARQQEAAGRLPRRPRSPVARRGMPGPRMPAWGILPVTLPAFTITGMWIVYAMALSNNHICPVHNWNYNQSCGVDGPGSCCTLDHIPLVSKCGTLPPESCFFSLICSLGSFMVILVGLLRYAHLLERLGPSLLNTLGLATGWVCAAGLTMVGNFQVDHAKVLHYIGAGVAFPTSMLFLLLQSILTYRMAKTHGQYWTGHLRSILTAVAFLTLIFNILLKGGVFFIQESFVLQHVAALCEWMFIIDVLVFYGTFTFEFGAISTDTFLVLLKASRAPKSYKGESGISSTAHIHSHTEGLAMA